MSAGQAVRRGRSITDATNHLSSIETTPMMSVAQIVVHQKSSIVSFEVRPGRQDRVGAVRTVSQVAASGPDGVVLDAGETIRHIVSQIETGVPAGIVAARFHNALARATALACAESAGRAGVWVVALSGGVFQNRLLLERTARCLSDLGVRVVVPERLPPNDGGVSYGQAAVAAAG